MVFAFIYLSQKIKIQKLRFKWQKSFSFLFYLPKRGGKEWAKNKNKAKE
jgi:hypothetical protein